MEQQERKAAQAREQREDKVLITAMKNEEPEEQEQQRRSSRRASSRSRTPELQRRSRTRSRSDPSHEGCRRRQAKSGGVLSGPSHARLPPLRPPTQGPGLADHARLPLRPSMTVGPGVTVWGITAWAQSADNEELLATIGEASRELALRAEPLARRAWGRRG